MKVAMQIPDEMYRKVKADSAKAKPRVVDWMIVGECVTAGSDTYSCEKSLRRLDGAVVISG